MSPLVTEIDHRRGGRTRLTVDGEQHELPTEDVLLAGLRPSQLLPAPAWEELRRDGRRRLAVRDALHLVARRSRTEADLRSHLGRVFEADAAAYAAARLRELGYIDDAAWARAYLERPRSRGRSRAMLRAELLRHGVPDPVVQEALTAHDDPEAALGAARTRWRQLRRRAPQDRDRLLRAYLQRRGFPPDDVSRAIRACHAEDAAADSGGTDSGGTDSWGTDSWGTDSWGTDSWGADSRGTDSWGTDSRGTDSRGTDSRGTDSRGTEARGADVDHTAHGNPDDGGRVRTGARPVEPIEPAGAGYPGNAPDALHPRRVAGLLRRPPHRAHPHRDPAAADDGDAIR